MNDDTKKNLASAGILAAGGLFTIVLLVIGLAMKIGVIALIVYAIVKLLQAMGVL